MRVRPAMAAAGALGVSVAKYPDCGASLAGPVVRQSQITMSLCVQGISDSLPRMVTAAIAHRGKK